MVKVFNNLRKEHHGHNYNDLNPDPGIIEFTIWVDDFMVMGIVTIHLVFLKS